MPKTHHIFSYYLMLSTNNTWDSTYTSTMTNLHSHSHIRSTTSDQPIVSAFGVCLQIFLFQISTSILYYPVGAWPASQDFSAREAGRLPQTV
ncbi:hypothetical protein BDV30DRAFT_206645 [Aspergillus minisclerotigenes]|uniref:Uncharacterized protein n=1 Tax=Aspergillus minisclerotigenes TaxID=656917 RepID=A0A5N6JDQ3_9EURO|nr:hypothetical protein BDV30DRAFT_206645 [Aspergillus minisclerotigenes]